MSSTGTLPRARRTQAERTEETRAALIEATISVIHRLGYNAATTAVIADEAGISRGSINYQFSTRAQLMSEVISFVYEQELRHYEDLERNGFNMAHAEEWPEVLWSVISRPAGMAVIEILQASRSDRELEELVIPTQERVEQAAVQALMKRMSGTMDEARVTLRLFVWAIRGLAMSSVLSRDPAETEQAVRLFRDMVRSHSLSRASSRS